MEDRNTKYFHGVMIIRRKRNKYHMLKDANDNWISDHTQLDVMITCFYKALYFDDDLYIPFVVAGAFPQWEVKDLQRMMASPE